MNGSYARPRHHLSAGDLEFVTRVLAKSPAGEEALLRLLTDEDEADRILDSDRLSAAMQEPGVQWLLSPRFFFYVTVRRAFRAAGLEDRDLADYVACMLADFSRSERVSHPFGTLCSPLLLSIDLLEETRKATPGQQFHLHAAAGNHYLFMTSFFAAFIEKRRNRRGAPGVGYYASVGRSAYARARDHRLAREYAMETVFDSLVHAFAPARAALEDMRAQLSPAA